MGESKQFDSNPKTWRMTAALALDGAALMEILSPYVMSSLVLPIACAANVLKNIGFLTASASRAALHQSLALGGNLADVTAKAGSQSMAAGLLGTAVGVGLSTALGPSLENFVAAFCALSAVHQSLNYMSLKSVALVHFDRHRLHLLMEHFIDTGVVLSPSEIAQKEFYIPLVNEDQSHQWLAIGTTLEEFCPQGLNELQKLQRQCPNEKYLLNVSNGGIIHLVFLVGAVGDDLVKGMLHAHLLKRLGVRIENIAPSHERASNAISCFTASIHKHGWKTESTLTNIEAKDSFRLAFDCLDEKRL
jgi:hypothetical protein